MSELIEIPDLGGADVVEIVELFIQPGDTVELEQTLAVMESDKATMDLPASIEGTIQDVMVKVGDKVSQHSPFAMLRRKGSESIENFKVSAEKQYNSTFVLDKSKVFIVHGHDDLAKTETARFVENLGFKAIILHEQANFGKTIIEKIEKYSDVGFGIVLYTPCDLGREESGRDLKPRARQNVIFEHGFLIGKLQRENVVALFKGNVETPNDISGVVYIEMDNYNAWKIKLAKELRESGYNIDMDRLVTIC